MLQSRVHLRFILLRYSPVFSSSHGLRRVVAQERHRLRIGFFSSDYTPDLPAGSDAKAPASGVPLDNDTQGHILQGTVPALDLAPSSDRVRDKLQREASPTREAIIELLNAFDTNRHFLSLE
jgi:hypothetical protein